MLKAILESKSAFRRRKCVNLGSDSGATRCDHAHTLTSLGFAANFLKGCGCLVVRAVDCVTSSNPDEDFFFFF